MIYFGTYATTKAHIRACLESSNASHFQFGHRSIPRAGLEAMLKN